VAARAEAGGGEARVGVARAEAGGGEARVGVARAEAGGERGWVWVWCPGLRQEEVIQVPPSCCEL
jgi:hypothetical protein